jgi:hypothetical protein
VSKAAVVIFARAPRLGRVKTRLVPPFTAGQALELHVACLEATALLVDSLPHSVRKFLYLSESISAQERKQLRLPKSVRLRWQRGRDLGARLKRMLHELFAKGYQRVAVIGSDSPTLPRARLLQALRVLHHIPVVIGPTEDGGYYLLGCRKVQEGKKIRLPDIFDGIAWGTSETYARTVARLRRDRVAFGVLPRWYDVDRPADLTRLRREVAGSRSTYLRPLRDYLSQPPPRTSSS